MNYGMIATGNHCNSDSLRGAPLPAVQCSVIHRHFGENVLPYGSHEWLPYSRIWAFLIILKGYQIVNYQLSILNSAKPLNNNFLLRYGKGNNL